jgi:hypothetical protein
VNSIVASVEKMMGNKNHKKEQLNQVG